NQRDAVKEQRRRKRPQKKIFQRRFIGLYVMALYPCKYISAQSHKFEPQIKNNKVSCRCHYHHSGCSKQQQAVILSEFSLLPLHIFERKQQGESEINNENQFEIHAVVVVYKHAAERYP